MACFGFQRRHGFDWGWILPCILHFVTTDIQWYAGTYHVKIVNSVGHQSKTLHIKEEATTSITNLEVNVNCLGVQRHPSFLSAYDHCHWIHWIPAFCLPHHCRFFAFKAFKVDGITIVGNLSPVVTMCSWQLGEDCVWQQLPDQIGGGKIFIFCHCGWISNHSFLFASR